MSAPTVERAAPTLDRAIGPVAATLLVIGGIVGSGIFLTTGIMAQALPSPTLLMLAWVAGGLFRIQPDGSAEQLLDLGQGSADLEYLAYRKLALIPMMLDGTVVAHRLD